MTETVVNLEAWKGKSGLEINYLSAEDAYLVVEHRKNKESREVSGISHLIPFRVVSVLRELLRRELKISEKISYQALVLLIQKEYGLSIDLPSWNGGVNRTPYYFRLHYFPLKILEWEGFVKYYGRGAVERLK